jgi:hypothetical protein
VLPWQNTDENIVYNAEGGKKESQEGELYDKEQYINENDKKNT